MKVKILPILKTRFYYTSPMLYLIDDIVEVVKIVDINYLTKSDHPHKDGWEIGKEDFEEVNF
jgi:hypothetical protein